MTQVSNAPVNAPVAAIDIGTNSVRLLICDDRGQSLEREMQITRLGQGVEVTGALHPDAISRTLRVLASYRALIDRHAVGRVRAAATSAARDAHNREDFFAAAQAVLGTRPELLSGAEEAALSFRGATHGLAAALGPFAVIDIGGGSTEFVLGTEAPHASRSVALGRVRMTERHVHSDPPKAGELAACADDVRRSLPPVEEHVPVRAAQTVIGVAGTITSLANLQQRCSRYDPSVTHHSRLTLAEVSVLCAQLASVPIAERRRLLVDPERAEVIVAGAVVLRTIMETLAIDSLLVSERDILDGLAASLV